MPSSQTQSPDSCSAWVQMDSETRSAIKGNNQDKQGLMSSQTVRAQFSDLPSCLGNHNGKQLQTQVITRVFSILGPTEKTKTKEDRESQGLGHRVL